MFASAEKSEPDRRDLLLSGLMGTLVLGTELMIPESAEAKLVEKKISKTSLSAFQRRDLVADFQVRCGRERASYGHTTCTWCSTTAGPESNSEALAWISHLYWYCA